MGRATAPSPMDGASVDTAPIPQSTDMSNSSNANGDPSMDGGLSMDGDPSMNGGQNMEEDPSMAENPNNEGGIEDDSTMSIINQLSPEDKETVRAYAESMLNRDKEKANNEENAEQSTEDQSMGGAPMMEAVVFKKGQLRKMNENFGGDADSLKANSEEKPLKKKNEKSVSKKSPFNSPIFK